jgi:YspA, cpYpsA-related SLOG family
MIDSRDFLAAKKRADSQVLLVAEKVALSGGLDFNDHRLVWARLDQVRAKHSDMVLLHGGSQKGTELIVAKWAGGRKVPRIAFKPGTGRSTPTLRLSSATMRCWRRSRSASWSSRAWASGATLPTKPRGSALQRFGGA